MPLTRNELIEMWASVKAIEYDTNQVQLNSRALGPHDRERYSELTRSIQTEVDKLKITLQSVLGDME